MPPVMHVSTPCTHSLEHVSPPIVRYSLCEEIIGYIPCIKQMTPMSNVIYVATASAASATLPYLPACLSRLLRSNHPHPHPAPSSTQRFLLALLLRSVTKKSTAAASCMASPVTGLLRSALFLQACKQTWLAPSLPCVNNTWQTLPQHIWAAKLACTWTHGQLQSQGRHLWAAACTGHARFKHLKAVICR
jgi:hypothetical protein